MPELRIEYKGAFVNQISPFYEKDGLGNELLLGFSKAFDCPTGSIRYLGSTTFQRGACNAPDVYITINLFDKKGMTSKKAKASCKKFAEWFAKNISQNHIVVWAIAGNVSGSAEVNKPIP